MINLGADDLPPARPHARPDPGAQATPASSPNPELALTEPQLASFFDRVVLAFKADNLLVYTPTRVLRAGKHSIQYETVSRIDDSHKIVTVYGKQKLVMDFELERVMKDLHYHKQFNRARILFFQDECFFFSVESYCENRTLADYINTQETIEEEAIRFIFYGILQRLRVLHEQGLAHLNLSPLAVCLDEKGVPYLQKFKFVHPYLAKPEVDDFEWIQERRKNWIYLAPELLDGARPDPSSDFYALGILFYFILIRKLPFFVEDVSDYLEQMGPHQIKINKNQIPQGWSLECVDFINRLLIREKSLRLGTFGGIKELLSHSFFGTQIDHLRKMFVASDSPIFKKNDEIIEQKIEFDEEEGDEEETPKIPEISLNKLTTFFDQLKTPDPEAKELFSRYFDLFDN